MTGPSSKKWRTLIGVSLLAFVGFIDFAIVNTVLPGIQRDLEATVGQLQWMMNGFAMMLAMFMVTMGRLGDIYGRRKVLYIGVLVFAAASMLAGLADDPQLLIACRILQGISGAITFTCSTALVTHAFPAEEQGRALGIFMSITAFGMAIGPVLGGLFLSALTWRWAFYVNVPVVLLGFLTCRGAVEETPRLADEKVDWLGLGFLVPGIGALITGLMESNDWGWTSASTLGLLAVGAACLVGFVMVERRASFPIIDLKYFRLPLFRGAMIAAFAMGGFLGIGFFLPPLYLMNVLNEAPYVAGLMLLPITGLVTILPPLIGRFADKTGPLPFVMAGQVALICAALFQMLFTPVSPAWMILIGLGLFGLGWGLQQATLATAVTAALPKSAAGTAIGTLWTVWNIGFTVSLAVSGLVFETVDKQNLLASLAEKGVKLSAQQEQVVHRLLSDPSKARELLGSLPANVDAEILPLFGHAFTNGYAAAMWVPAVVCGLALLSLIVITRRAASADQAS